MVKLKKIIILAFNPPWLKMMASGYKQLEFRDRIGNDWNEGTEVYLAITKNGGGSGKVEAKFTIGEIMFSGIGKLIDWVILQGIVGTESAAIEYLKKCGYSGQQYAIEIKDLQMLDQPIELSKIYSYNKVEQEMQYLAEEFVESIWPLANQNIKKEKTEEHLVNVKNNFENSIKYYDACKIKRMPQSWCYGGVIQK